VTEPLAKEMEQARQKGTICSLDRAGRIEYKIKERLKKKRYFLCGALRHSSALSLGVDVMHQSGIRTLEGGFLWGK